ncbi:hypothetical protein ACH5RR_016012 [Cinchona calisaya]|uniref:Phylloplanin n=1 Tax=Cinchona calisaya TaxID=153742 RepID=A0ABD2ZVZ5_9GENT
MASHGYPAFFLTLTLLLAIITNAAAQGSVIITVSQLRVYGNLYCTPTGNLLPIGISLPLVNANVVVSCNVGTTNVVTVQATTNLVGFFNVTFSATANLSLNLTTTSVLPNCAASVQLPVLGCLTLPLLGVLRGSITPVGLEVDQELNASVDGTQIGITLNGLASGFSTSLF